MPSRASLRSSLFSWLVRWIAFTLLAVPIYFFLAAGIPGFVAGTLALLIPILTLPLALLRRAPAARARLESVQIGLSVLGVAAISLYWVRVFPELLVLAAPAALALWPAARRRPGAIAGAFAATGVAVLAAGYAAPPAALVFYVLAVAATWWALGRAVSGPSEVLAAVVSYQLLAHTLTGVVYWEDQRERSGAVASQEGIDRWQTGAGEEELDLHQITSFLIGEGGSTLLFPRHQLRAVRVAPDGELTLYPTAGIVTNDLVLDRSRDRFFFVSGGTLYEGETRSLAFRERASLQVPDLSDALPPAYVKPWPDAVPRKLLVVFDGFANVVLYELDSGEQQRLSLPYEISSGTWHPDGNRLVLYGKDKLHRGHLLLVDPEGRVLRERSAGLVDRVELGRGSGGLLAMYFLRGRLEQLSPDTLEGEWAVRASMPRAVTLTRSGRCLLAPSYSRGTLSILRSSDGSFLRRLRIGRRVRSITAAVDARGYWIASAAGQFVVEEAALPEPCRAGEAETGAEGVPDPSPVPLVP